MSKLNVLSVSSLSSWYKADAKIKLEDPSERALVLCLLQTTDVAKDAALTLQPHRLCEHLYELSNKFSDFYRDCRVLNSENEASRLLLCRATKLVMARIFSILGISPLSRL